MLTTEQFPWGKIVKVHKIGKYKIVEYKSYVYVNGVSTDKLNKKSSFHPFINNKDTSHSFNSLDKAMIFMVMYNNLEINEASQLSGATFRMLKMR